MSGDARASGPSCSTPGSAHDDTSGSRVSHRWLSFMLKDSIDARPLGQHRLFLRFEDDVQGEVDIAAMIPFTGIPASLADPASFAEVTTDPETGTITWPNGADLDPGVLYATITGVAVEERLASAEASCAMASTVLARREVAVPAAWSCCRLCAVDRAPGDVRTGVGLGVAT
jgi:hypothetical protein